MIDGAYFLPAEIDGIDIFFRHGDCLSILFTIRDDTISDENIKQVRKSSSRKEISKISGDILQARMMIGEIEEALLNAIEPEIFS
jgi:hypothetical protein